MCNHHSAVLLTMSCITKLCLTDVFLQVLTRIHKFSQVSSTQIFVRMLFSVTTAELFREFTDITIVSAPRKLHKRLQLKEVQVERTILISIIF